VPITNGHLGLLMLALVVVAIMLGFPTAFTLMGMGMIFTWLAYEPRRQQDAGPDGAARLQGDGQRRAHLDPAVRLHGLPGRARQPDRKAVQEPAPGAGAVPGSLAVATLFTCAVFRHRHRHRRRGGHADGPAGAAADAARGYDVQLSAGAITAGGCLGILIPPSVMLIVYGATAGVSVVQLYAGASSPG
jgi:TRAP-type mannitol/chloroaromatic compound transport system permease large subunit